MNGDDPHMAPVLCKNALDVAECVLDALSSWLNLYQSGSLRALHLGASAGDSLKLTPLVTRSAHSILPLGDSSMRYQGKGLGRTWNAPELLNRLEKTREELDAIVRQADIGNGYEAIIIDGNMAVDLREPCFDRKHGGFLSGTPQFQSMAHERAVDFGSFYLRYPVDDLESFLWVLLWTLLYQRIHPRTDLENMFCDNLNDSYMRRHVLESLVEGDATGASVYDPFQTPSPETSYNPILLPAIPSILKLEQRLKALRTSWADERARAGEAIRSSDQFELSPTFTLLFHVYAYSGVRDLVEVLLKDLAIIRNLQ